MTPEQINLVQSSFRMVTPNAEAIAGLFYGRFFDLAPHLRPLFPEDMAEQKKKFMQMLELVMKCLNSPGRFLPAVVGLGQRHTDYEVTPEDYRFVGEALMWALRQGLGEAFTDDVQAAWIAAYGTLSDVMIGAGSE
ncbi:globin family protein [Shimia sagamensis]|uniref:Nitric oxide dioxygenase n=1 Tax=Shimia sagamensis TaxID=1566352 RepID=A0ABY1P9Y1_9RHOB|nr:globin family protein [Shimia sagamensis]SMP28390.1 nitric oxide dioxygenase [Shimia sagamensis]